MGCLLVVLVTVVHRLGHQSVECVQRNLNLNEFPEPELEVERLPNWFDFDWFKTRYHKTYSYVEGTFRRSVFTARCVEVFKNRIAYRLGLTTYRAGINKFTDWTPREFQSMFMKRLPDEEENFDHWDDTPTRHYTDEEDDDDYDLRLTDEEAELERWEMRSQGAGQIDSRVPQLTEEGARAAIEQMLNEASYSGQADRVAAIEEELAGLRGRREMLSQLPANLVAPAYAVPRLTPVGPVHEQAPKRRYVDDGPARDRKRSRLADLSDGENSFKVGPSSDGEGSNRGRASGGSGRGNRGRTVRPFYRAPAFPADAPMMNWSLHECFHEVYDQGENCGQCYVMVSTALAEFFKCAETEQLQRRKFSKNYVKNCGQLFSKRNYGCDGGSIMDIMNFIAYSGLYTVKDWRDRLEWVSHNQPDLVRKSRAQSKCPIDKDRVPLDQWGKTKIDMIPKRVWPAQWMEHIRAGPMAVTVSMPKGVDHYEAGVHMGTGCHTSENWHSMILVGYGRENGHDFWLFRNSWGPLWGEQGHFKLSTQVPHECLHIGMRVVRRAWRPQFAGQPQRHIDYLTLAELSCQE